MKTQQPRRGLGSLSSLKLPTASSLTDGERVLLSRWRRGETQARFAKRFGLTMYRLRLIEEGLAEKPRSMRMKVGSIEVHESLKLSRRRDGVSLRDRAAEIGVTPYWLRKIEAGVAPAGRVVEWMSAGKPAEKRLRAQRVRLARRTQTRAARKAKE